jgi:hypothetical protein
MRQEKQHQHYLNRGSARMKIKIQVVIELENGQTQVIQEVAQTLAW